MEGNPTTQPAGECSPHAAAGPCQRLHHSHSGAAPFEENCVAKDGRQKKTFPRIETRPPLIEYIPPRPFPRPAYEACHKTCSRNPATRPLPQDLLRNPATRPAHGALPPDLRTWPCHKTCSRGLATRPVHERLPQDLLTRPCRKTPAARSTHNANAYTEKLYNQTRQTSTEVINVGNSASTKLLISETLQK